MEGTEMTIKEEYRSSKRRERKGIRKEQKWQLQRNIEVVNEEEWKE